MTNEEIIKEIEESAKLLKQTKATVNAALCHARNILEQKVDSEDVDAAYNRGLNDAWELAQKLYLPEGYGGFHHTKIVQIFNCDYLYVPTKYTVQEALAKIEAYEKDENTIKVGDVVTGCNRSEEYVVLATEDEMPSGHPLLRNKSNGHVCFAMTCSLIKTGEHIDILSLFT